MDSPSEQAGSDVPPEEQPPRQAGGGLWKSMLGIMGGRFAQPVSSFFLFFFSARLLTTAQFGVYVLIMGLMVLFQSVSSLGLSQVLSREIGQNRDNEGAIIGSALILSIPASLVSGLLFVLTAGLLRNESDFILLALLSAVSLPFSTIMQFSESVFASHNAGGRLFRISMAEQFVRLAASLSALLLGFGLYGLTLAYVFGRILASALITYYFFSRRMSPPLRVDWANLRYMWRLLIVFVPMNFLANLYFRADIIVLAWLMSDSDVGLYGCAMRIASFSYIIPDSVTLASLPHFSHLWVKDRAAFGAKMSRYLEFLLAIGLLGSAGMAFFGGTLLTVFFGTKYAASSPLLAILAFSLPALGFSTLPGYLLQAAHHEKLATLMVAISTSMVFVALTIGTMAAGLTGAALGIVFSLWLIGVAYLRLASTLLCPVRKNSPLYRGLILLFLGMAVFGVVWPSGNNFVFCLSAAALALVALLGSGLAKNLLPREIRDTFDWGNISFGESVSTTSACENRQ